MINSYADIYSCSEKKSVILILLSGKFNSFPSSGVMHCVSGFTGSGKNADGCADVDECQTAKHNCDSNAECTNTDGTFTCQCKNGFSGDGVQCRGLFGALSGMYFQ